MLLLLGVLVAEAGNPPVEQPEASTAPARVDGTVVIDAKVPAELLVDDHKLGQLWVPGEARFEVPAGSRRIRVYTHGDPTDLTATVKAGEVLRVLVGRSGVSLETEVPLTSDDPDAPVAVSFRCVGTGAQVRIGGERLLLGGGTEDSLALSPGSHRLSVRNRDGTVIWAAGTLEVSAAEGLVVQVSDGRLPELFGPGRFHPAGG